MSVPALRQPKFITQQQENRKKNIKTILADVQYVIITLNDKRKLVVSSDAYHGIITAGEIYKCVFCDEIITLDSNCKEKHKISADHKKMLEMFPHANRYSENLIREFTKESSFCTICNVTMANVHLIRHLTTQSHIEELQKALIRADSYKPF